MALKPAAKPTTSAKPKTPAKPKATKPKATAPAASSEFDTGLAVPPQASRSGTSDMARKLGAMPIGSSFLEAVEGEGDAFKDAQRKKSNSVTGAIRRFKNKHPGEYEFVTRTVDTPELGRGVRVWRVEVS